jgi:hypothetical protein
MAANKVAYLSLLHMTLGLVLVATVSADPDLLQDVCVADLSSGISSSTIVFNFLLILVNYIHDWYRVGELTCPAFSSVPSQHNFFIFLGSHLFVFDSVLFSIHFLAYVLMLLV